MTATSTLTHLECSYCGAEYDAAALMNLCPSCAKPLLARYDLAAASKTMTPDALKRRAATMWRYGEVMPVQREDAVLSLGEGWTPLLPSTSLGAEIGCPNTWIKDEGLNPTAQLQSARVERGRQPCL